MKKLFRKISKTSTSATTTNTTSSSSNNNYINHQDKSNSNINNSISKETSSTNCQVFNYLDSEGLLLNNNQKLVGEEFHVYEGYFVLSSNTNNSDEDENDEEIIQLICNNNGRDDRLRKMKDSSKVIHPFYGEVSLSRGSFEGVSYSASSCGNILSIIVRKGDKLRRICQTVMKEEVKEDKLFELEWQLHQDIEHRSWNLEKIDDRLEFSHLGRDEDWMNEKLAHEYIEDVEPIVEKFIDSKFEMISVLGAYNWQNILSFLEVKDLNNCYQTCNIMRELISSRDFLIKLVESQCISLPRMYYQKTQRNLKHCKKIDLLKLFFERRDKLSWGRKLSGSYVIWLNEEYWKTKKTNESIFGKTIILNSVWWFDFGTTFTLRKGQYKVSLRYKIGSYAPGMDGRFNIKATGEPLSVDTSSMDTVCRFTNRNWELLPLGEVTVSTETGILTIQIYDHANTYKAGLEIDYLLFEKCTKRK